MTRHSPTCKAVRTRRRRSAWDEAVAEWRQLATDDGATFDREIDIDGSKLEPIVTWGTNPGMSVPVTAIIPNPEEARDASERAAMNCGARVHGIESRHSRRRYHCSIACSLDRAPTARLEDLRAAAKVIHGHKVHPDVTVLVVPGSEAVKDCRRARRARSHLQGSRRAMARAGMLDVPGHESGHPRAEAAMRVDQQS